MKRGRATTEAKMEAGWWSLAGKENEGGCVLRQLAGEEEKRKRREWELMRTKEWGRCQWLGKGLVVAGCRSRG